jgi:hypothetical protein
MPPHEPGCVRGDWLVNRPKLGLFWTVLFQEGPACDCARRPDCSAPEQSDGGAPGAGDSPTAVNTQVSAFRSPAR